MTGDAAGFAGEDRLARLRVARQLHLGGHAPARRGGAHGRRGGEFPPLERELWRRLGLVLREGIREVRVAANQKKGNRAAPDPARDPHLAAGFASAGGTRRGGGGVAGRLAPLAQAAE